MRIAICFSGQLRSGIECYDYLKYYMGSFYDKCDFFIHTWNNNSYVGYNGSNIFPPNEMISQERIDILNDLYKPKHIYVEEFNDDIIQKNTNDVIKILWYSFYNSIQYKKDYEEKNNFKYDIVIKLRFDIIFCPHRSFLYDYKNIINKLDKSIYIENIPDIITQDDCFVDDVFYYGSSKNMDIMADFYNELKLSSSVDYCKGFELIKYLNKNNIDYYKIDKNKEDIKYGLIDYRVYSIYRSECLKYSPIYYFKECSDCDDYHYSFNDHEKYITGKYIYEIQNKYGLNDIFKKKSLDDKKYFIDELKLTTDYVKMSELLLNIFEDKNKFNKKTYL